MRDRSRARPRVPVHPLPVSRYGRWRALALVSVYGLMTLHVVHWRLAGRTLAPLELHEVMFTAELGIVTAGFLLMAAVTIGTLVFGRFFCSWACHIMALQELSAWILRKIGIRPQPVRSRLLLAVPPLVLMYMFGWPQLARMWAGREFPPLRTQTDLEGISSFVTTDFWRNLPDPWITALTFLVCGFLVVYVLGARAFCTYGCPYGALFLVADRFAPGRIRVDDSCLQCGTCTAVCTSGVRVHEEVARHGTVVNPRCLKDLDCVSACPENALHYGWGSPALAKLYSSRWMLLGSAAFASLLGVALLWPGAGGWWSGRFSLAPFLLAVLLLGTVAYGRSGVPRGRTHFTGWEEAVMGATFLATLGIYRQLYDAIPFLLTVGLGAVVAYLTVLSVRLLARPNVFLMDRPLKAGGKLRPAGRTFAGVMLAFLVFSTHSGAVQYHKLLGYAGFARWEASVAAGAPAGPATTARALDHLLRADQWGLFSSRRLEESLAALLSARGDHDRAVRYLNRVVARDPTDARALTELGHCLIRGGAPSEAEVPLRRVLQLRSATPAGQESLRRLQARARYYLAETFVARGRLPAAEESLVEALRLDPGLAEAHFNLGALLLDAGRPGEAEAHLREAVRLDPGMAPAHHNLAVALARRNRPEEAIASVERALALDASDPQARALREHLMRGKTAPAVVKEVVRRR